MVQEANHFSSAQDASGFIPFAGGACNSCVFWLDKLGCCRSDCERFRSMIPVSHCLSWKQARTEAKLANVTFSAVPWMESSRRIA